MNEIIIHMEIKALIQDPYTDTYAFLQVLAEGPIEGHIQYAQKSFFLLF